jgi:hypothetical protein
MAEPTELVRLDHARAEIAKAKTIDDCRKITDKAEAARYYAKKIGMSIDVQNDLVEIVIESMARAGEILDDMKRSGERADGDKGRPKKGSLKEPLSLADLGLTKKQSHVYQKVAAVPMGARKKYVEDNRVAKTLATTAGLLREQKAAVKGKNTKRKTGGESKIGPQRTVDGDCWIAVRRALDDHWLRMEEKQRRNIIDQLRKMADEYEKRI